MLTRYGGTQYLVSTANTLIHDTYSSITKGRTDFYLNHPFKLYQNIYTLKLYINKGVFALRQNQAESEVNHTDLQSPEI